MKRFEIIPVFMLLLSIITVSCSTDEVTPDGPRENCDDNKILVLSTPFDGSNQATVSYNSFTINTLDPIAATSEGTLSTTSNLTYQLTTNTSLYNQAMNIHGIIISREKKYLKFDLNNGTGQEYTFSDNVTAPVLVNGNVYVIEITQQGYANNGTDIHYEIKNFDMQNGTVGALLPISTVDRTFDNKSFFHVETVSSTTNGTDRVYFMSGTNLITVNIVNNTATHTDLYPSFSQNDWVAFYGIKYDASLGLIAIKKEQGSYDLVRINPITGAYTTLVNIPGNVNTEFYSVAYRACDFTYYLTTLDQPTNPVSTKYYEFNLVNNTVINTQNFQEYAFGLELIPE